MSIHVHVYVTVDHIGMVPTSYISDENIDLGTYMYMQISDLKITEIHVHVLASADFYMTVITCI